MNEGFQERRRDSTCTYRATRCAAAWSLTGPETIVTDHRRSRHPATPEWDVGRTTCTPGPTDCPRPGWSMLEEILRPLEDLRWPPDTTVQLTLVHGRREYRNSQGTDVSFDLSRWEMSLTHRCGRSLRRVTSHQDKVFAMGKYLVANPPLPPQDGSPLRSARVACSGRAVVLGSAVTGVLFHELIGHATEEGDLPAGRRLLPPGFEVVAEPPAHRYLDDEGIESVPLVVIADGWVVTRLRDRRGCLDPADRPSGHAWASPHASTPRLRLPHLSVHAHPVARGTVPAEGLLHCGAVRGARYFRGQAVLDVASAELIWPGGREALAPFRLAVGLGDLADVVALTDATTRDQAPAGLCVKNGEPLPSRTAGPELLLPVGAQLLGAP
jgi:hypothetical protein